MDITGAAALVTGAASGLGAATAAALAARGATVYGIDLEKGIAGTTPPDGVVLLAAARTIWNCSAPCSRSTCSARST